MAERAFLPFKHLNVPNFSAPMKEILLQKLKDKTAKVAVIGMGYVGLPLATILAEAGFEVTGIDPDQRKIEALSRGEIGTGEAHSVGDFLDELFGYVNLDWQDYIKIAPRYLRPNEVDYLQGDPSKARRLIGWEPRVLFKDLVRPLTGSGQASWWTPILRQAQYKHGVHRAAIKG